MIHPTKDFLSGVAVGLIGAVTICDKTFPAAKFTTMDLVFIALGIFGVSLVLNLAVVWFRMDCCPHAGWNEAKREGKEYPYLLEMLGGVPKSSIAPPPK